MNEAGDQAKSVNPLEKCETWLSSCSLEDCTEDEDCTTDETSSIVTDTTESSASAMSNGIFLSNDNLPESDAIVRYHEPVELQPFANRNQKNNFNCRIYKSKIRQVHFGDVTNINGTVVVSNIYTGPPTHDHQPKVEVDETKKFRIVDRKNWLAQPPMAEPEMLEAPAQYVVISHTATEEGFTQSDNTLLVRLLQMFHIESRKWDDIAYNFMIGSDGNVYEGRGWNAIGAHTFVYNRLSVGISFVGCFIKHLPPEVSLNRCKNLIRHGVEIGAIAEDYSLVGHCQCTATVSPGTRLFEELKTWEHWDGNISVTSPPQPIKDIEQI